MDIENVLQRHGVFMLSEFEQRAADGDGDLENDLFEFYSSTGEMPYGTMKARGGDPGEWIFETTCNYFRNRKPL